MRGRWIRAGKVARVGLIQAMWRRWVWVAVRSRRFFWGAGAISYFRSCTVFGLFPFMQVARWFGLCVGLLDCAGF